MEIKEVLALVLLYGDCANEATRKRALELVPGLRELVATTGGASAYRIMASVDSRVIDYQDVISSEAGLDELKHVFQLQVQDRLSRDGFTGTVVVTTAPR